jgi:hypothetical protein
MAFVAVGSCGGAQHDRMETRCDRAHHRPCSSWRRGCNCLWREPTLNGINLIRRETESKFKLRGTLSPLTLIEELNPSRRSRDGRWEMGYVRPTVASQGSKDSGIVVDGCIGRQRETLQDPHCYRQAGQKQDDNGGENEAFHSPNPIGASSRSTQDAHVATPRISSRLPSRASRLRGFPQGRCYTTVCVTPSFASTSAGGPSKLSRATLPT